MMWDKSRLGWLMLLLVCALIVPATAIAQEEAAAKGDAKAKAEGEGEGENFNKVVFEVEAAVYTKYVWRGVNLVDDWVFQPALDVKWREFTFSGMGNWDLTDENGNKNEFSRFDLGADYALKAGPVSLHFGAEAFLYPDSPGDTFELYASAGMDVLLSPTLTIHRDIDEAKGWYVAVSASHTFKGLFKVSEKVGMSPRIWGNIGWADDSYNRAYYRHKDYGFADLTLGFDVPWKLGKGFEVFAGVYASMLLDSTARDRSSKEDNFWFGFGGTFTF